MRYSVPVSDLETDAGESRPASGRLGTARRLLPLLLVGGCVLISHGRWLTNRHTPGSDGWRVFPYVEFVDHSNEVYPLWYPQVNGGVPVLADADRFVWLSWLLDSSSGSFNLGVNLVLLAAALFFALSTFAVGRAIGLRPGGAALAACVLTGSQFLSTTIDSGRFNALLSYALAQWTLCASIRAWRDRRRIYWLAAALAAGMVLAMVVHYALISLLLPLALLHWSLREPGTSAARSGLRIVGRVTGLTAAGAALAAATLLPLLLYNTRQLAASAPRETMTDTLPLPASLAHLGLPIDLHGLSFFRQEIFPFVSVLVFPALALLIARWRTLPRRTALFPALLVGVAMVVLLGRLPVFGAVAAVMARTPLLWHVRQALVFHYLAALGLALLCGLAFDQLRKRPAALAYALSLAALLAVVGLALGLGSVQAEGSSWPADWPGSVWLALALVLVPVPLLPGGRSRRGLLAALLATQVLLFRPDPPRPPVPNERGVVRPLNPVPAPEVIRALAGDPSHFSMMGPRLTGVPQVRSLDGYSLYFAPEHRLQLELLTGQPVLEARAYWYRKPLVEEWDQRALVPLNVKYLLQPHRRPPGENWTEVARQHPFVLWKRNDWQSALRLVAEWEVSSATGNELLERLREPRFLSLQAILLDEEPGIEERGPADPALGEVSFRRPSSDSLEVDVEATRDALLFIPEYYDRGWRARVDGSPARVLRANGSFRAVAVPAGSHRVRLDYRPAEVRAGALLSLLALAGGVVWVARGRWRAKARG